MSTTPQRPPQGGESAKPLSHAEKLKREIQERQVVRPKSPPPSRPTGPGGEDTARPSRDDDLDVPDPNPGLDGFK